MTMISRLARHAALPLLLAGVVLLASGCMTPRRTVYGGGGSAAIVLLNQTNSAVYYVYISPCSSSSWGEDQLGDSEVVQPGATRTFSMSPGCWDLKARFSDGREVEERQVRMSAGGSRTWTLSN
jgi:hypothetical protein